MLVYYTSESRNIKKYIVWMIFLTVACSSKNLMCDYTKACDLYYNNEPLMRKTNDQLPMAIFSELPMGDLLIKPDYLKFDKLEEIDKELSKELSNAENIHYLEALHMKAVLMKTIPGCIDLPKAKGDQLRIAYDQYEQSQMGWEEKTVDWHYHGCWLYWQPPFGRKRNIEKAKKHLAHAFYYYFKLSVLSEKDKIRLATCYYWQFVFKKDEKSKGDFLSNVPILFEHTVDHPLVDLLQAKLQITNNTDYVQNENGLPGIIQSAINAGYTSLVTSMFKERPELLWPQLLQAAVFYEQGALNEVGHVLMHGKLGIQDMATGVKLFVLSYLHGSSVAAANLLYYIFEQRESNPSAVRELLPYLSDIPSDVLSEEIFQTVVVNLW